MWALSGLEPELLGYDNCDGPSEDSSGGSACEAAANEAPPPGCAPDAIKLFVGNIPKVGAFAVGTGRGACASGWAPAFVFCVVRTVLTQPDVLCAVAARVAAHDARC